MSVGGLFDGHEEYLRRCSFPEEGTPVRLGVSGGADSTALLLLALAAQCSVSVIHVDHGLRAGSADDAAFVVALCKSLDVEVSVERLELSDGPNLEERAREERRAVLGDRALVGHTADDQAETMLLNLLRGAGPTGLAAMVADDRRPLLRLRRSDTRAICERAGVTARVDSMNSDPRFRRVRVREELLPLIDEIFERDAVTVLSRSAALFAELSALLEELGRNVDPTEASTVAELPPVLARDVLARWIRIETGAAHPVDAKCLDRALEVASQGSVATELPGGHRLVRSGGVLSIRVAGAPVDAPDAP
ncbi:MAG: tRNA lysidine(34) synthetase TilS [Acidobacteria bacterium]|nr:tRNA lysidine(34) synthetase TilS [Acidobacteriota bacterium]